ncbi:MAG: hypothetical protein M1827_006877 [Pycnora praestabilis]|nr:MAG: hypothetical protein M1827_006877 [Pycnora praestabilis]
MVSAHETPHSEVHVLIIGAGITGLLLAQGLKKNKIKYTIFESESATTFRPREWSVSIHWSLPLLEHILPDDLRPRLQSTQNDPFYNTPEWDIIPIYNGETGECMKEIPLPRTIRCSRRKLRALCAEGIDVQYGKKLRNVTYGQDGKGVIAHFTDGHEVTGTTIIGSDGPRSMVRELLLGEKAKPGSLGIIYSHAVTSYGDAEKAKFVRKTHPIFSMAIHPDGTFAFVSIQDVPDPDKPETWRFQMATSWPGERDPNMTDADRLKLLKERASPLAEPYRSANLFIPDGSKVSHDDITYWVTIPWDNHDGRISLAGDAAHPLPPFRGQGLNHCICDVDKFVNLMKRVEASEVSLPEAVTEYDDELVKRGSEEVKSSHDNALMLHDWNQVMESPLMKKALVQGEH